ncbi:MAG: hypothetical protein ATN31_06710 [Candidatus Epulonipiscioides saccharophilum]|nr:MAG: hypothetical protein ATN31_06710 [Epulopiscium sp. AS2M-Bin001]
MRQTFVYKTPVIASNIKATNHNTARKDRGRNIDKSIGRAAESIVAKVDKRTAKLCFITTASLSQSNFGNLALK